MKYTELLESIKDKNYSESSVEYGHCYAVGHQNFHTLQMNDGEILELIEFPEGTFKKDEIKQH
jgi:hypothetical protein